jgi:hypothetical protein
MKKVILLLGLIITGILFATPTMIFDKIDYKKGRNNNVCKDLKGEVLVYVIFVDTKTTSTWTEFDIKTTMDSINKAAFWLEDKAKENNVKLAITTDFYIGEEYSTIRRDLPEGTIRKSVTSPSMAKGFEAMNKWADVIANMAGRSFEIEEKDGIRDNKQPNNKEKLVAYLRDQHNVESVVLLYMVNNYYRDDISIPVNFLSNDNVEFAVVSYKYPAGIAHNILHLFGASDFHETIYRKSDRNINFALSEFPNAIMQNPYAKDLNTLDISSFTKYLIGWSNELDEKHESLCIEKGIKVH